MKTIDFALRYFSLFVLLTLNVRKTFMSTSGSPVTRFIANVPLLLIPYALYHLFALSGGTLGMKESIMGDFFSKGDLVVLIGIVTLYVEIFKSTRTGGGAIMDHMFSMVLFIVALVEFLLAGGIAGTSSFFLLMMIMLVDVIGGFTITIKGARRDFGAGGGGIPLG
jgi:hypothetical protein